MASQGDRDGSFRRKIPRHWNDEYIKGEVHQSWAPDEEFYPLMPRKGAGGGASIVGIVSGKGTGTGDFAGITWVDMLVIESPCNRSELIGTTARVYDRTTAILDLEVLTGFAVWASERIAHTMDNSKECTELTPCYWSADMRSCEAVTAIYRTCV